MDARLRIVQMLMSTPAFDSVSQVRKSVETSLDAADTSVRATSRDNYAGEHEAEYRLGRQAGRSVVHPQ
jgi:hypothetical protein